MKEIPLDPFTPINIIIGQLIDRTNSMIEILQTNLEFNQKQTEIISSLEKRLDLMAKRIEQLENKS